MLRNGAEALFELNGIHKQSATSSSDDKQDIRVDKAANRADQRNQSAHHGDDEQTQRFVSAQMKFLKR